MLKEKYLTLPCIIGPNGTTEINKRRGTNSFVCLFTFSYRQISCQIDIRRSSAYVARTPCTRRDLFVQPPNDSGWVKAVPLPRKRPCGVSAGNSGSAPSPGASVRAANQAAGRGQRLPACSRDWTRATITGALLQIIDSSQRGRIHNLTRNLPITRFIALSVPPQRYLHFVLYLHNKNPRHNLS